MLGLLCVQLSKKESSQSEGYDLVLYKQRVAGDGAPWPRGPGTPPAVSELQIGCCCFQTWFQSQNALCELESYLI